jgi:hypothetical protein
MARDDDALLAMTTWANPKDGHFPIIFNRDPEPITIGYADTISECLPIMRREQIDANGIVVTFTGLRFANSSIDDHRNRFFFIVSRNGPLPSP